MERTSEIQQIYQRLANLEEQREQLRLTREHGEIDFMLTEIDVEMKELRLKLQDIQNNVYCPVVKGNEPCSD